MIFIQTDTVCVNEFNESNEPNEDDELYEKQFDRLMYIENCLDTQKEEILNYLYDICIEYINSHTLSICDSDVFDTGKIALGYKI